MKTRSHFLSNRRQPEGGRKAEGGWGVGVGVRCPRPAVRGTPRRTAQARHAVCREKGPLRHRSGSEQRTTRHSGMPLRSRVAVGPPFRRSSCNRRYPSVTRLPRAQRVDGKHRLLQNNGCPSIAKRLGRAVLAKKQTNTKECAPKPRLRLPLGPQAPAQAREVGQSGSRRQYRQSAAAAPHSPVPSTAAFLGHGHRDRHCCIAVPQPLPHTSTVQCCPPPPPRTKKASMGSRCCCRTIDVSLGFGPSALGLWACTRGSGRTPIPNLTAKRGPGCRTHRPHHLVPPAYGNYRGGGGVFRAGENMNLQILARQNLCHFLTMSK